MDKIIWTILSLLFLLSPNLGLSQVSQGGRPYSFDTKIKVLNANEILPKLKVEVPVINMPRVSNQAIDSIIKKNEATGKDQFAYEFYSSIDFKRSSVVDSLELGLLYRLSIKSEGAKSLNVIFSKYSVPPGAKLFIYNNSKKSVIGAFTSNNNSESNRLPTLPVFGDQITVEYFEPYFTTSLGILTIGKINHDFVGVASESESIPNAFGSSGACQVDINCAEGNSWQDQKRAVCRIVIDGSGHCTGTLLNNTNQDGKPYFLTANHCICEQEILDDCIFIFNYESPTCGGGDGSTSQSIEGGSIRATNIRSDFTLLELRRRPFGSYNPFYAGWDRNNSQGSGGVGIHHPSGDVKKIATHSMIPANSTCMNVSRTNDCSVTETFQNINYWLINSWNATTNGHSVTEGGSSGSALFNNNGRVIGQLFGGCAGHNDNCVNPYNDFANYGKISSSWYYDGSPDKQLREWLDPSNSEVTYLDGANVCGIGVTNHLNLTHTVNSGVVELKQAFQTIVSTSTINSGAIVTYEAGESITLNPGFDAQAGSNFTARIKEIVCVPRCDAMSIDFIPNLFTPNGDGVNDQLCYLVSNATSYEVSVYNSWGNLIFSGSGGVTANPACVWNGAGTSSGQTYYVIIKFRNPCDEEKSEAHYVTPFFKSMPLMDDSELEALIQSDDNNLVNIFDETSTLPFDFDITPNPNDGSFNILVEINEPITYSLEIINSIGVSVYRLDKLREQRINIDKSSLNAGVYYVRINTENSVLTKKMVVK